ncbi:MAG: hypothetical protein WCP55_08120 [Lentisphaerota bacterium]
MTKLYSYVVNHDIGYAPNPYDSYCTLAHCKYIKIRKNITDMALLGDWIIGTGGVKKKESAGYGKIIYVMRVDEIITLAAYYSDLRFKNRIDNHKYDPKEATRNVLISQHYFYFGKNAIPISEIPQNNLIHPLEKKGPRYRADFNPKFINQLTSWLENKYYIGMHGAPCGCAHSGLKIRKRKTQGRPHSRN